MPSSCLTYTPLWTGTWGGVSGTYVDLPSAASAFDAIRLSHLEDYTNSGCYKCSDIGSVYGSASIYNTFYEGQWYTRHYGLVWNAARTRLSSYMGQQTYLQSGQNWAGANAQRVLNCTAIYGVKYNDTGEYDSGKIYADRTLIYSADAATGRTSLQTTERMDNFAFVQIETNNPFNSHIMPGNASRLTLFGLLQSDTRWYYRGTYWNVTTDHKTLQGSRYLQVVLPGYSSMDSGSIPANYGRNVQPVQIWGIGRSASK